MPCSWCHESGYVLAHPREDFDASAYAFRCDCSWGSSKRQVGIPQWKRNLETLYIPEYVDELPTESWIVYQFEQGLTKEPEFQRRLKIWGRERFVRVWDKYKAEKAKSTSSHEGTREDRTETKTISQPLVKDIPPLFP